MGDRTSSASASPFGGGADAGTLEHPTVEAWRALRSDVADAGASSWEGD
jgi:hypothetical protein